MARRAYKCRGVVLVMSVCFRYRVCKASFEAFPRLKYDFDLSDEAHLKKEGTDSHVALAKRVPLALHLYPIVTRHLITFYRAIPVPADICQRIGRNSVLLCRGDQSEARTGLINRTHQLAQCLGPALLSSFILAQPGCMGIYETGCSLPGDGAREKSKEHSAAPKTERIATEVSTRQTGTLSSTILFSNRIFKCLPD
jgi:hypothetical protein